VARSRSLQPRGRSRARNDVGRATTRRRNNVKRIARSGSNRSRTLRTFNGGPSGSPSRHDSGRSQAEDRGGPATLSPANREHHPGDAGRAAHGRSGVAATTVQSGCGRVRVAEDWEGLEIDAILSAGTGRALRVRTVPGRGSIVVRQVRFVGTASRILGPVERAWRGMPFLKAMGPIRLENRRTSHE